MNNRLKFVLYLSFLVILSGCEGFVNRNAGNKKKANTIINKALKNDPEITFETLEHDFGKVRAGEKAGWYFRYKNTGGKPLLITSASASCGCTVPEYQKEPVLPGEEGFIKVVFDTSGRSGKQTKTIILETNALQPKVMLRIMAEITDK